MGNNTNVNTIDVTIKSKLESIMFSITQQCCNRIFEKIQEKIMRSVAGAYLSSKVRDMIACLFRALIKSNPTETLQCFLLKICQSIETIIKNPKRIVLLMDDKADIELILYLNIFVQVVCARGDILFN
ncbi:unnamed protein product [Rotaria sp. Silwood1]|nr:unnamed protein product [Rotaria sp. Silwood1]CAF3835571.1 unnamed protein product [Rotaria sp. Silwood1]CAF4657163.1 unnamed protein product [Rotaria sp. Silwood1]CAF4760805.1 unnamed protein product [Rotaria sp. Silwood1]CAF4837127.1 unnamed protein product [Rotaria sp. Silwood1]